jgi:hypothetical protein
MAFFAMRHERVGSGVHVVCRNDCVTHAKDLTFTVAVLSTIFQPLCYAVEGVTR